MRPSRALRSPTRLAAGLARLAPVALLAPLLALAPAAGAQAEANVEGPLDNDVFLPTSTAAEEALVRGDARLAEARAAIGEARERTRDEAFEAWRRALSEPSAEQLEAAVRGPEPTHDGSARGPEPTHDETARGPEPTHDETARGPEPTHDGSTRRHEPAGSAPRAPASTRTTEGVGTAVRRRLGRLAPAERAAWTARFAARAETELAAAGTDPGRLAGVLRRNPLTPAAARAALVLHDLELERGDALAARVWLERGSAQLPAAPSAQGDAAAKALAAAFRRRAERGAASPAPSGGADSAPSSPAPPSTRPSAPTAASGPGAAPPAGWERAAELLPLGATTLGRATRPSRRASPASGPGQGLRPGLAFLDDGRLAVQTGEAVLLLRPRADAAPALLSTFDPAALVAKGLGFPPPPFVGDEPPGWELAPEPLESDLLVVVGQGRRSGTTNALVRLTPPREEGVAGLFEAAEVPTLRWAVAGDQHLDAEGRVSSPPLLAPLAGGEVQPGVVVAGARVLAEVRVVDGETNAWLVCLDAVTGLPLWTRFLAKGADLVAGGGRFAAQSARPLRGQPLVRVGERVFAGTHLGAASLVEIADGALVWSLRNRRRELADPGWDGGRPVLVRGEADAARPWTLLWAPADADRLYWLDPGPLDPDGTLRGSTSTAAVPPSADERDGLPFRHPPRGIGEGIALSGGGPDEALVLSLAGAGRTVSIWEAESGRRIDSLDLARGESFRAPGLAGEERLYVATDRGLYLFDRTRELYLLDYEPLAAGPPEHDEGSRAPAPPGGSVHALGDRVYVLGPRRIWAFAAR